MDSLSQKDFTDIRFFLGELREMKTRKRFVYLESGHLLCLREERKDGCRLIYSVKYSNQWIQLSHHHFHFLLAMSLQMIIDSYQLSITEAEMGWIHKDDISCFINPDPSSESYASVADYRNKLRLFIIPKDHQLFGLIENDNRGKYRIRINPQYIRIDLSKRRTFSITIDSNVGDKKR